MFEVIAIGVFVFVALTVAGFRALDTLASHKAKNEAARLNRVMSRANRVEYTGATFSVHGSEISK